MNLGTGVVRIPVGFAVVVLLFVPMAQAQKTTKFTYTVGPQAVVSITNNNGPITVKASGAMRVVVNAIFRADTVDINAQQRGNRIEFQTRAAHGGSNEIGRADYEVFIPNDACVVLSSSTGSLNADGVQGDLIFEGGAGPVNVTNIRNAHVHIKTLNGTVTLTNIASTHIEVTSASGNVELRNVTGPDVSVHSGKGRIAYSGDPGKGKYSLKTHSGEIEVLMPPNASVQVTAHSFLGHVDHTFPFHPSLRTGEGGMGQGFVGTSDGSAAFMAVHSFKGNVSIRQTSGRH